MNVNYRENSIDPSVIKVLAFTGQVGLYALDLCFNASNLETDEQYQQWVTEWKTTYDYLSKDIAELKRSRSVNPFSVDASARQTTISAAAKLANTLLNARQFARDKRKIRSDEEFARHQSKEAELV